jgi:dTDP-4-dehydrorhamnose 3,5-epimerase
VRFTETHIDELFVVDLERHDDERGFFARAFAAEEFEARGLGLNVVHVNLSSNRRAGTIRGLHYQAPPATERKFFRCIQGAVHAVAVDVRPGSPTYGKHAGVDLDAEMHRGLYVPELCATGYQALADGAEVIYFVSAPYAPECERGLRYDDPALGISWPLPVTAVSDKDRSWALLPGDEAA